MKKIRLDKILANMGYGSRSEIKREIRKGHVMINNQIIKDPSIQVDPESQSIIYSGQKVVYKEYRYYMMNKPDGVISATEDKKERTVLDLMNPQDRKDVFPVGRLDKDTEGFLLLTNDGELAHELLSPKKHVSKTYYAKIEGIVTLEDMDTFKNGVTLEDGYKTLPAKLTILCSNNNYSEIELVIYEGKFHQVKRMFEAVGKKVTYLKRLAMSTLSLDEDLNPGEYRALTDEEINILKNGD